MQMVDINLLKEHPRNREFFDDIEGERWQEFVESIKTSGIIVPLIITQDYVVISGNQRLKAAKELGLKEVPCEVRTYEDKDGLTKEDWMLKDLIETNLRQRGMGNLNPMKLAKCILELERIYRIKRGKPQSQLQIMDDNSAPSAELQTNISQKELAEIVGLKERRLRELKKLNELIPELQKLIEEGKLTTKAGEQLAYLEPEQQRELFNILGETIAELKRSEIEILRKQMEEYRKQYMDMQNKIAALEKQKKEAEEIKKELEKKIAEIKPEIIEKEPDDYQELKSTLKTIKEQSEQLTKRLNELEQEKNRLDELRRKALEEKRQALEEKARAEAEVKNMRYELEQLKQQYGIEAKKQCELADKLIGEIKKVIANATGILELMDIEKLPDYKYNDFSTTLIIFIDKLEKLYQSAEQKAKSGKVVFFKRKED
ncbi:plasmid partitioning protein ParB [Caldanaerobacter subterraneus subsp. yonseiensis KB-1]|uniref:Plasmid partitioning protein ParB n=1 Tax=Caldanaerobacter subterraneus subsp. yonseiensis KB-1 TaxID=1388761 RepID=U5CP01_CALSX|nr:ParB/RepB/Spo0J family partition protein [Caldanaerobacter subterraneus]ERM91504.1 plasmid partitioning protein ParB [Caldanaerobacter subterraneus subsp. yonseiensis KB-1]